MGMVGRGELGFMQMLKAYELGLVGVNSYIGTIWALLLASCLGPLFFRVSMKVFGRPDALPTVHEAPQKDVDTKVVEEPLPHLLAQKRAVADIKASANGPQAEAMEAL